MFILLTEILFWTGIVQTWKYRGKVKESAIMNGAEHELTKLYDDRRQNWIVVTWVSFFAQLFILFI